MAKSSIANTPLDNQALSSLAKLPVFYILPIVVRRLFAVPDGILVSYVSFTPLAE